MCSADVSSIRLAACNQSRLAAVSFFLSLTLCAPPSTFSLPYASSHPLFLLSLPLASIPAQDPWFLRWFLFAVKIRALLLHFFSRCDDDGGGCRQPVDIIVVIVVFAAAAATAYSFVMVIFHFTSTKLHTKPNLIAFSFFLCIAQSVNKTKIKNQNRTSETKVNTIKALHAPHTAAYNFHAFFFSPPPPPTPSVDEDCSVYSLRNLLFACGGCGHSS